MALRELLDDLEQFLGPPDEALVAEAERMLDAHERNVTKNRRRRATPKNR